MSAHPIADARGARSVAWLANASGVPALTIARIEAGLTRRPSADTLAALAGALDTTANDLEVAIVRHRQSMDAEAAA